MTCFKGRDEMKKAMLSELASILTIGEYRKLTQVFADMPDYEFDQIVAECVEMVKREGVSYKDLVKKRAEFNKNRNVTFENSALNCVAMEPLRDEVRDEVWHDICQSRPTDRIYFKSKDDEAICNFWKQFCSKEMLDNGGIPSDLFFSGNVSLLDCEITVDERDKPFGQICTYRVVIYPDYIERIKKCGDEPVDVGAVVVEFGGVNVFLPILVFTGVDQTFMGSCGLTGNQNPEFLRRMGSVSMQEFASVGYSCMATWYGIQLALLHPTVKDVFAHPKTDPVMETRPRNGGKKRRVVRYIKKHVITAEELTQAEQRPVHSSGITRHTLIWYVIGHWRHYSDGKKVFIKPYWKGEMRHLRMDLDGREREIIIEEGGF